jgi:uncharacterized delta-60 repeat protein
MLQEWLRRKVQRQSRFSPDGTGERAYLRRWKFTPRLELLEDRTLLSDGVLDPTFGVGGLVNTGLSYLNNTPFFSSTQYPSLSPAVHQNSLAVQADGKIVVAGVSQGATTAFSVGRFNLDGTLDSTFGTSGLAAISFPGSGNDQADGVALQADGKIVVAGSTLVGGHPEFGLIRLNANGTLDTTFGKSGFVLMPVISLAGPAGSIQVAGVAVQANGRIVVAGTADGNFAVARVYADGMQDSDFNGNGITEFNIGLTIAAAFVPPTGSVDTLTSLALQPDGQIVVAGYTNTNAMHTGLNPVPIIFNPVTNQFVPVAGGSISGATNGTPITIQTATPHGLISGELVTISGVGGDTAANGIWTITVVDSTHFILNNSVGNGVYTANTGTWNVTDTKAWNFAVARINAVNGLLDTSFSGGIVVLDFFHALNSGSFGIGDDMAENVIVQPDGKIVAAGRTWLDDNRNVYPNFGVARFNPDGSLDKSLNQTGLIYTDLSPDFSDAKDIGYSVAVQGDGKIVIAGTSDRATNNTPGNNGFAMVRYNLDGTEDQTFGLHGQVFTNFTGSSIDQATNIVIEASGQILLAGTTNQGGGPVFSMGRYSGLQSGSFQFSQAVYSVNENGGAITITVSRGGGSQGTVTVNFATSDGVATGTTLAAKAGTDYATTTGTLTFAPGQITATFTVPVMSDGIYLSMNKVFNLALSNPTGGAFLGFQKTAMVTIVETDQPGSLAFSAASYSVAQNGGSITITVTRSNGSAGPVGITYTTSNGTAMAGRDYTSTTGTLNFAAGVTSQNFTVPILNSGTFSSTPLTFNVSLSTPTGGATLGNPSTATVNIGQANPPGAIAFSSATYSVAENAGSVALTVNMGTAAGVPVTVTYTTSDGTAVAGTDYTGGTGTVTITPGQTSATITIAVRDDGVFSTPDKSFTVTLSNPTNGSSLGTPSTATVTLLERDGTPTQLFIAHAYLDILGRPVDSGGLATWTAFLNGGGTRQQVAAGLTNSQEYRQDVVQALYMHYLNRAADAGGLATYTAFLAAGGTDEQVAAALAGSQEYFQNRAGGNNNGFVSALYQDILNRSVDPSGLAGNLQLLANGTSRTQIAFNLLTSTEYLTNLVSGFYLKYLRRPADSAGLSAFVTALQAAQGTVQTLIPGVPAGAGVTRDEDVIAIMVGSQEYFNLVTG